MGLAGLRNAQRLSNTKRPMSLPEEDIQLSPDEALFAQPATNQDPTALANSFQQLQLIYQLGLDIVRQTDLETVFSTILKGLCQLVDLERCFIATFDDRGALQARAAHGISLSGPLKDWPVSKSIINHVLDGSVALLSVDAQQDDQFSGAQSIKLHQIRSVMCVPLGSGDGSIGIVYADSRLRSGTFSEQDLKLITALSHYCFLAIRSANELRTARQEQQLSEDRWSLLQEELFSDHRIRGHAQNLIEAYHRLKRAAASEAPILIHGESGTGKELFAQAAHKVSARKDAPFISVHIAENNENLIESELFGHVKGSFTGATIDRRGKFELATGGTIFLDEVAEIPPPIQAKLLRVLETQSFERVGGNTTIKTDFRLICATHQNLEKMMKEGQFREDLYYRLMGVVIQVPSLRDRLEDIPELVTHILEKLGSKKHFCESAIRHLQAYTWPGNVRQLIRAIESVVALTEEDLIEPHHLPDQLRFGARDPAKSAPNEFASLNDLVSQVEEEHFKRALALAGGSKEQAREMLQVSKAKFYSRLKDFGLQ